MKLMKRHYLVLILLFLISAYTSYSQQWMKTYRNMSSGIKDGENKAYCITIDSYGFIYVAGFSSTTATGNDICLIKYTTDGDTLWVRNVNGSGNSEDKAYAITVDDQDNIYVTGYATRLTTGVDIVLIKFSSTGTRLWTQYYNGSGNSEDKAYVIQVDHADNIYVGGYITTPNHGTDYITIKYSPNGDTLWSKTYDGDGHSDDAIKAITVDKSNNVIVTGDSRANQNPGSEDIVTIKYNASNGNQIWLKKYSGPGLECCPVTEDKAYAITVDDGDAVYVTGTTQTGINGLDIVSFKYKSNGDLQWTKYYNGSGNGNDIPQCIMTTHNNDVVVVGTTRSTPQEGLDNYITITYHANNGNVKWSSEFDSPHHFTDVVSSATLSEDEKSVYVTGYSTLNSFTNRSDIQTVKYKMANGTLEDSSLFNASGLDENGVSGVDVDNLGNVYITGFVIPNAVDKKQSSVIEDCAMLTMKYPGGELNFRHHPNPNEDSKNGISGKLYQNYPNPFNPVTLIRFHLDNAGYVEMKIYDLLGREIQTLVKGNLEKGEHSVQFNGEYLASGIYLYELKVNDVKDIKKMILIK
jgi:hypothetical protein